ncbi:MAG: hypothetical protein ACREVW_11040, partial [Burkholderiales bacterium]
ADRFLYISDHTISPLTGGLDFTHGEIQRKAKNSLNPMSDAISRRLPAEFMQLEGLLSSTVRTLSTSFVGSSESYG